jgi:hypothetical protein
MSVLHVLHSRLKHTIQTPGILLTALPSLQEGGAARLSKQVLCEPAVHPPGGKHSHKTLTDWADVVSCW